MSEQLITLPIKEFLHLCLGRGYWSDRPIPKQTAELVRAITRNSPDSGYHIQFTSRDGEPLTEPVLWNYSFWVVDNENTLRQRAYSERARNERFIFEANVRMVSRAYTKYTLVEGDLAHVTAFQYVKKRMTAQMKEIGVTKLYTDVKEL